MGNGSWRPCEFYAWNPPSYISIAYTNRPDWLSSRDDVRRPSTRRSMRSLPSAGRRSATPGCASSTCGSRSRVRGTHTSTHIMHTQAHSFFLPLCVSPLWLFNLLCVCSRVSSCLCVCARLCDGADALRRPGVQRPDQQAIPRGRHTQSSLICGIEEDIFRGANRGCRGPAHDRPPVCVMWRMVVTGC